MRNKCILSGVLSLTISNFTFADDNNSSERMVNHDAIPEVISTEDTKIDMNRLEELNLKKADWMLQRLERSGKELPSAYEAQVERRRQRKFDDNPKQNRPLEECIKDGNVIDDEVQKCINGLIEPVWSKE